MGKNSFFVFVLKEKERKDEETEWRNTTASRRKEAVKEV